MTDKKLQWHPAFIAAMQIDFTEEGEHLMFFSEYELNRMPMRIDVLVIKKSGNQTLKNEIGKLLRGHNIFEYKSPEDSLNIDDFYKVYGYACFYKANTEHVDTISQDDITITFVCNKYPYKMLKLLRDHRNITSRRVAPGLYYLEGDYIPIQLVMTKELSAEKHRWLNSLRLDLAPDEHLEKLLEEYEKHKDSKVYQAAMDLIVRANEVTMEEAKTMCEALRELFAEDFKRARAETAEEVVQKAILLFIEILLEDGCDDTSICNKLLKRFPVSREDTLGYIQRVRAKNRMA